MRQVLFLLINKIRSWSGDWHVIMALIFGILVCIYNCTSYIDFANFATGKINILEPYVVVGNDGWSFLGVFLGNILFLSDSPFVSKISKYEILRVGKVRWLLSKTLYIVLSCLFYSFLILIISSIYTLTRAEGVSFTNSWSQSMNILAFEQPSYATSAFRLSFGYSDFVGSESPVSAALLTILFNSLYAITLCLIIMTINIIIGKNTGWVVASVIHIAGYIIFANGGLEIPYRFSMLCYALPALYSVAELNMSMFFALSFGMLLIIICYEIAKIAIIHVEME